LLYIEKLLQEKFGYANCGGRTIIGGEVVESQLKEEK